jgi:2-polyprenyl-3-methyl-5-hydroxy-6-metoxy-1,4-benzoquinol methylase
VAKLIPDNGNLLDVGCGNAALLQHLHFLGKSVDYLGIDRQEHYIQAARRRFPDGKFYCLDPMRDDLSNIEGPFDAITLVALIEHLPRPEDLLARLTHVLKEGGLLFVTTPSRCSHRLHSTGARIGLFSREADAEHIKFYGRKELEALAADVGLKMLGYRRFMLGFNQLATFRKESVA